METMWKMAQKRGRRLSERESEGDKKIVMEKTKNLARMGVKKTKRSWGRRFGKRGQTMRA